MTTSEIVVWMREYVHVWLTPILFVGALLLISHEEKKDIARGGALRTGREERAAILRYLGQHATSSWTASDVQFFIRNGEHNKP